RCASRFNDRMNVGTFVGIMALMFVLELPDKTFLATIIMATRARPLMVVVGLFLGGAAYLLFVPESEEEEKGRREAAIEKVATRWKEITTAFVVIFIGEFGDLTQIQAANFEARLHQPDR